MSSASVIHRIKEFDQKVLDKKLFLGIYPIVFIIGLSIRVLLSDELLSKLRSSYWVSENNIFNYVFANHGIKVFTTLFIILFISKITLSELKTYRSPSLLPSGIETSNDFRTRRLITRNFKTSIGHGIRYGIIYFGLIALFTLKNYGSTSTGGECKPIDLKRSLIITSCSSDEKWVPGTLNISGHYLFIVTLSLSLIFELKLLLDYNIDWIEQTIDEEDDGLGFSTELKASIHIIGWCSIITLLTILAWVGVLSVTAIFYHTLIEKIIGLTLGYVIPVINYIFIVKFFESYV
ncbi:putative membrane protein [Wickerhamomyces ciferrii]|uniref:Membrane protein n=1 Tax=Wickerhamomyces ciferrii (strain ATCC 14091 / BCRC 22168 / CBS 111 / JCM 3599 / NBRC 0793 / NRRL Y-1031 F-60-10) TaxID=1206466 RepID=K0KJM0_WICCF|nr:uncharacterized protein BN7_1220 [Wickerhamomyces ciferrii]CCH41679.1 putative membrane protein [Wickerhamomyces ciferrii]